MNTRLIGVLIAMVALLAAALATGTKIYYGVFCVMAIMLMYAAASVFWTLLTVEVEISGVRTRVARGEKLMTILNVKHASPFPVGTMTVLLNVPGSISGTQEVTTNITPFKKHKFRNVIRCPHRGEYMVGVTAVRVEDVFGLINIRRAVKGKLLKVTIFPGTANVEPLQLNVTDIGPEFRSRASEDNAAPSDVRTWQEGDELKKVHWKLSMRKHELMVRTFEESARPDTLIVPDVTEITALRDQRLTLEDCICEAALSAVKAQLCAGYPVRMPLQSKTPNELAGRWSSDLPGFTDALTRVHFDSPFSYEQLLMQMSQRVQRTGGIILITGKLTSRVADIAMRMQMSSVRVKLIYVADAPRTETLEMLERVKMAGVRIECVDPRSNGGYAASTPDHLNLYKVDSNETK